MHLLGEFARSVLFGHLRRGGLERRVPAQLAAILALVLLSSCSSKEAVPAQNQPRASTPVRVAAALQQDVPVEIRAIGTVEASSGVTVKSRLAGQIVRVHLRDGEDVRKGDLLFELDPQPALEQVRAAEANLAQNAAAHKQTIANVARDRAQALQARAQADRYAALMKEGITSKDEHERFRTAAQAAEASLAAVEAAVESTQAAVRAGEARLAEANLELSYTKIVAPISGRAGAVAVKQGNLIKENDIPLVTILQVTPVYVSFSVPEQEFPEIRRSMRTNSLSVSAAPDEVDGLPARGLLDFVDNSVDTTTGTIRLRATFPNGEGQLWPGQFVNVTLRLKTEHDALLVPTAAIQNSQDGSYVWVVKPDTTVEMRPVKVARTLGTVAVLGDGISTGEKVVTEGQLRIRPGTKVQVLQAASAPSTASPGVAQ